MRNKELKLCIDLFKFYVIQITKDNSFRTTLTDNKEKIILNFIEEIKKETNSNFLSEDYCKTFIEYQFDKKFKTSSTFGRNYKNGLGGKSIQIEWIFGKTAIQRWRNRTEKQKLKTEYLVRKRFKKDVKIDKVFNTEHQEYIEFLLNINPVEENEKKRFPNTSKGFVNCQLSTTLFNHKSQNCSMCKFAIDCKELLKNNMYKVYRARKYHNS